MSENPIITSTRADELYEKLQLKIIDEVQFIREFQNAKHVEIKALKLFLSMEHRAIWFSKLEHLSLEMASLFSQSKTHFLHFSSLKSLEVESAECLKSYPGDTLTVFPHEFRKKESWAESVLKSLCMFSGKLLGFHMPYLTAEIVESISEFRGRFMIQLEPSITFESCNIIDFFKCLKCEQLILVGESNTLALFSSHKAHLSGYYKEIEQVTGWS